MAPDVEEPIVVPPEPVAGTGTPFPVAASIAPVVGSLVIFLLTRSPFVLAFAALGPLIAVAGLVDSRWSARRRFRADGIRYRDDLARIQAVIDERHETERCTRREASTGVRAVLDATTDPTSRGGFGRWRMPVERRTIVVVGYGDQPSRLRVDGPAGQATAEAKTRASMVADVPVEVDAARGIGVVGPPLLAGAFARGILLQLCSGTGPDSLTVVELPESWSWADSLPHRQRGGGPAVRVIDLFDEGRRATTQAEGDVLVVMSECPDDIPPRCASLVRFTGVTTAVLHGQTATGAATETMVTLDLVSAAEATAFTRNLAALALTAGLGREGDALPASVSITDASAGLAPPRPVTSLSAVLGTTADAGVLVDLVGDGPHAIVGGTTGSGKSELLVTWATSLATRYPPDSVNLLLVDFKGGAAFAPLLGLPHVVGVVTDLDTIAAARALESLRAEVRFRERYLRDSDARDIAEVTSLPRLVIVVDEFAAMLDGYPDLHALFVDLAARGRSLGMHLILCTQRPAGVVKDSLLANCGLRMSLRVNNRADSTAILGADTAAFLPPAIPGRLAWATPTGIVTLQVASTSDEDVERASGRWPHAGTMRRPWLDPLPATVAREDLVAAPGGIRLGLADHPAQQRQDTALWRPDRDGSILIVGGPRTGKTALLDTIAVEAARLGDRVVERAGFDAELAWDVLHSLVGSLRGRTGDDPPVLVLLDGLDSLLAGIDPEDALAIRDAVLTLLRDGPRTHLHVAVTVQRLAGPVGVLGGFVGSTVLLGTANRQEHVLAGGESAGWVESRRPGNAIWRGVTVQLCAPEAAHPMPRHAASRTVSPVDWRAAPLTLIVSNSPVRRADQIRSGNREGLSPVSVATLGDAAVGGITVEQVRSRRDGPVVIVGDSDQWQAHWSLLSTLREDARIVVDGCSPAEFRAVTRIRMRPPLLHRVPGRGWLCTPDGGISRVALDQL
ncbi:FtsK/SpoIIIE domain-containing protein [Mycetocola sp. CAN_C7]|uniref:FtsK/SpoIIIE domain-containing protein n=1 Tax=Mycetocola sp. CAN_C7 TaxID=2787724 RepID=UPI0018C9F7A6